MGAIKNLSSQASQGGGFLWPDVALIASVILVAWIQAWDNLGFCAILKLDAAVWFGDAEMICHKLTSLSFLKT